MGGFTDFLKSPAGLGVISGLAGWAANARRGTPWNNIGRGGIAGLAGYKMALDDQRTQQENALRLQKEQQAQQRQQQLSDALANPESTLGQLAAAGATPEMMRVLAETRQRKVKNVLQSVDAKGNPKHLLIDEYGQPIGDGYAAYQAPKDAPRPQYMQTNQGLMALGNDGKATPVLGPDGGVLTGAVNASGGKQQATALPMAALKTVQGYQESNNSVEGINTQLQGYLDQIAQKKLSFGPLLNRMHESQNWWGSSNEQSRAYAAFRSGVQRMVNESLRLNKGVQTEGDAQRAMNELFANINDTEIVKEKLQELININQEAIARRNTLINDVYGNFGVENPSVTQSAPQTVPQAAPTPQQVRQVTRTGRTKDGRKVVQYSDGTVELAGG